MEGAGRLGRGGNWGRVAPRLIGLGLIGVLCAQSGLIGAGIGLGSGFIGAAAQSGLTGKGMGAAAGVGAGAGAGAGLIAAGVQSDLTGGGKGVEEVFMLTSLIMFNASLQAW